MGCDMLAQNSHQERDTVAGAVRSLLHDNQPVPIALLTTGNVLNICHIVSKADCL